MTVPAPPEPDMFARAVRALEPVVENVSEEQFAASTPCPQWDVRTLLNHIVGGMQAWAAGARGEARDLDRSGALGDDHVASFRAAARDATATLTAPGVQDKTFTLAWGESPGRMVLGLATADAVVHGWDLAEATGQRFTIDEDVADAVLRWTSGMLEPRGSFPRGDAFAEPVAIDEDAPVFDQMLAFLGRRP